MFTFDLLATETAAFPFSTGEVIFRVTAIIFFLLLNAFFVASEFSIVKVRKSQLDALEETEPKLKKQTVRAKRVLENLDGFLSANQLGITLASIALGALGEPFVSKLLEYMFVAVGFDKPLQNFASTIQRLPLLDFVQAKTITHTLAFLLSYAVITYLHVVLGELLPKSIAIRKAVATTMWCAAPLIFFYKMFKWAIALLNGNANWILKKIGINPISEGENVHSAEELALLVTESSEAKEVTETEREILINALELSDLWVRDIMTPRAEVIALDADTEFAKNWDLALKTKHTRFPLVKGHLDNAIGLVHIKDMLGLLQHENPDLMKIKRELKVVPETMALDTLLKFFRREHQHLAMVVDEFGSPVGLVFLDDVIEELVGDIHDEFDKETTSDFTRINATEFVIEGGLTLNDLSGHVPELDFDSGEVTTVGGYVTQLLGRFPATGESLRIEKYEATVTSTDDRRVGQIHFRHLSEEELEAIEEESGDA